MNGSINSKTGTARRRRYGVADPQRSMTALKRRLLTYIAECGLLTTVQAGRIMGMNTEAVYKHLRHLYDLEMVERIAVPYASLAPLEANGPNLAFGPGQNIHRATRQALRYLQQAELIPDELASRKLPDYGPKNSLFLAHELLVRDVRVWLELCAREHGGSVDRWVDWEAAHLPPARPDAWFIYRLPNQKTLVGLVEADRGTERGDQWIRKADDYSKMLATETLIHATKGKKHCRLVVVALTEARRDKIAEILYSSPIGQISYVTFVDDLLEGGLDRPIWNHNSEPELVPFVDTQVLQVASLP